MEPKSDLTLDQLRAELRKRGAKTTGRKCELVERLQCYTRNDNFGHEPQEPSFKMILPPIDTYRDINVDSDVPPLLKETVSAFLRCEGKELGQMIKDLYAEKHIQYIRHSLVDKHTFVHAQVASSHRKGVLYYVDISLDNDGTICEAQCECAVGMGPIASCKHVSITLYALTQHTQKKPIITHITCTQKLQTFHTSKPHSGSPLKCQELRLKVNDTFLADPRKDADRNRENYAAHFRNVWMSTNQASQRPIFQLYSRANIRAVDMDHTYCRTTLGQRFLAAHRLNYISQDEAKEIERNTREQNASRLWSEERLFRLTASNFGKICKSKDKEKVTHDLLYPRDLSNVPAIRYGRQTESVAIKALENAIKQPTRKCGLFISKEQPFIAASPDRLVNSNNGTHVVEVKCPFSARDKPVSCLTIPYLEDRESQTYLKTGHDYYYQVQGQLFCTGLKKCLFIIYTAQETKRLVIERDDDFISSMVHELCSFYHKYFQPALLSKFLYKE